MRWWLVLVMACHPSPADRPASDIVASLDRGGCLGTCPIYSLVIYRDGAVEYFGSQFVKEAGVRRTRISSRALDELHQIFKSYATLGGAYERTQCNDVPLISTSYRVGGTLEHLQHCSGQGTPQALTDLEDRIDQLVHSERWVGTQIERDRHHGYER